MIRPHPSIRDSRQRLRFQPQLETLERRWTMDGTAVSAAAGLPWLEIDSLTYSFALDGTEFGAANSNLFAELKGSGTPAEWQAAFHSAFMEWLGPLGKQIREVPDSGIPFGTLGATQHDARVGDVRIAAIPLSDNVMAESIPHNMLTQGSWAGDIVLNSNASWTDLHQVFSVAMHEFGHVLGLGHNTDPASPMFFHGVYSAMHPTTADIRALEKLYAGVHVDGANENEISEHRPGEWEDETQANFDATQAIPLQATLSTTAQYTTSGALTADQPTSLYELESIGEIDHVQFLNIAIIADHSHGLMPQVTVYDSSGDKMSAAVLHSAAGVLTVQVKDVEPNHSYFVAVSAAVAPADFQVGSFNLYATYGTAALSTRQIGTFDLTQSRPIAEQAFHVASSRLIHLHAQASSSVHDRQTAVWITVVDEGNNIVAQLAMPVGSSRSAPLFLIDPGRYRLIMHAGKQTDASFSPVTVKISIDEVSIDVGPGIIDPTLNPNLNCTTPGNNPTICQPLPPVTLVDPPVYPDPNQLPVSPSYPSIPPWEDPSWHYWPIISLIFPQHNSAMPLDTSGDSQLTPLDALRVIAAINSGAQSTSRMLAGFVDVNNDQQLTPVDALLVINYLNQQSAGEGEMSANSLRVPTMHDSINPQGVDLTMLEWNTSLNWAAPLGKLGSHRRQTDAIVNVFQRLAAGGYDNFTTPNRPGYQVMLSN